MGLLIGIGAPPISYEPFYLDIEEIYRLTSIPTHHTYVYDKDTCPRGYVRFFNLDLCMPDDAYLTGVCPHATAFQKISECMLRRNTDQYCPSDWIEVAPRICIRDKTQIVTEKPVRTPPSGYERLNQIFIRKITPLKKLVSDYSDVRAKKEDYTEYAGMWREHTKPE